jgi:hypothetical protein
MARKGNNSEIMKLSPLEKVMNSRKQLVESILGNLKKDNRILPPNWNKSAMRPQNPASKVYYRGGNRDLTTLLPSPTWKPLPCRGMTSPCIS